MEVIKPKWVIEHKFEFEPLTEKEREQMIKYRPVHDFFPERGHKIIETLETVPGTDVVLTCRKYVRNKREHKCGLLGCPKEMGILATRASDCNTCNIDHTGNAKRKRKRSHNHKHRH